MARIRIDTSNPIGAGIVAAVVVAAAVGIFYGGLSSLVEKVLLPALQVPAHQRSRHFLSKLVSALALLLLVVGVVGIVLPAFGINTGSFNLIPHLIRALQ
jgi:hypothetical protein